MTGSSTGESRSSRTSAAEKSLVRLKTEYIGQGSVMKGRLRIPAKFRPCLGIAKRKRGGHFLKMG